MHHIETAFNITARKNFVFVPQFRNTFFGIVIFWVGEKNYPEK